MIENDVVKGLARTLLIVPAATMTYAIVLHHVFVTLIQPRFSYAGYRYTEAPFEITLISWFAVTVVAWFLPRAPRRPSTVILWVLYVVVVCPAMLMLPYLGPMGPWEAVEFGFGLGASFTLALIVAARKKNPEPLPIRMTANAFWIVVGGFTALTYLYVAATTGISLSYLQLADIYDQRADYREAIAESTALGYLVSNQANVVNPLILVRLIQQRRWGFIPFVVLGQLVLYTATGFKSVLFSLVAITLMIILFKRKRPRMITLLWGASALLLVCWFIDRQTDSVALTSLFGRRFLYTPARLSGLYFEWYSHNPLSMMANSILSPFIDTEYEFGPARTIAIYATGSSESSLNANIFAAGFAEFGWVGLLGVGVLLGIYLRVLDRAAGRLPIWMVASVVVMPSVTMANTALHTAMLSHGLVAAVLLLALVPRGGGGSGDGPTADERPNARSRGTAHTGQFAQ